VSAQDLSGDLVRFILRHDTTKKLLREHAPDTSGHCPKCPAGASTSGKVKSPCTLYLAAQAAEKLGGSRRDR
jgi:hypothetical protein